MNESARCLGPEKFRDWVEEQHAMLLSSRRCPEDVAFRRLPGRWVESDEVLEAVAKLSGSDVDSILTRRRGQVWKGIAAWLMVKHAGMTRRDVARVLGLGGGSGVSYQIKLARQAVANDSRLANRIKQLEQWPVRTAVIEGDPAAIQQHSCGYTSLLPLGDNSFLLAYSDFLHRNTASQPCKAILVRRVVVEK